MAHQFVRFDAWLTPEQRDFLQKVSKKEYVSASHYLRALVEEKRRRYKVKK